MKKTVLEKEKTITLRSRRFADGERIRDILTVFKWPHLDKESTRVIHTYLPHQWRVYYGIQIRVRIGDRGHYQVSLFSFYGSVRTIRDVLNRRQLLALGRFFTNKNKSTWQFWRDGDVLVAERQPCVRVSP